MPVQIVIVLIGVSIVVGVALTRMWHRANQSQLIVRRLEPWINYPGKEDEPSHLIRAKDSLALPTISWFSKISRILSWLKELLEQSGCNDCLPAFIWLSLALLLGPALVAFAFGLDLLLWFAVGIILSAMPAVVLIARRRAHRSRFSEQLPDAIDLMVSVLRSGHSVAQAIKSVAHEMPDPCGHEFEVVLRRMNIGQPLAPALFHSAEKFQSYELDLMRRAIAIQGEVGGSLADLLEKTNVTLRQRLKLVRQVKVLTAQSRLTGLIVGLLPFVLAGALNYMSPGYLAPLVHDQMGRSLLIVSVILQMVGLLAMRRLSTMKV